MRSVNWHDLDSVISYCKKIGGSIVAKHDDHSNYIITPLSRRDLWDIDEVTVVFNPYAQSSRLNAQEALRRSLKAQDRDVSVDVRLKPCVSENGYEDKRKRVNAPNFRNRGLQIDAKLNYDREANRDQIRWVDNGTKLTALIRKHMSLVAARKDIKNQLILINQTLAATEVYAPSPLAEDSSDLYTPIMSRSELQTLSKSLNERAGKMADDINELVAEIERKSKPSKESNNIKKSGNKKWGKTKYELSGDSGKPQTLSLKRETPESVPTGNVLTTGTKAWGGKSKATIAYSNGSIASVKKVRGVNPNKQNHGRGLSDEQLATEAFDKLKISKGENVRNLSNTKVRERQSEDSLHHKDVVSVMNQTDKAFNKKVGGSPRSGGVTCAKREMAERNMSASSFAAKYGHDKAIHREERGFTFN